MLTPRVLPGQPREPTSRADAPEAARLPSGLRGGRHRVHQEPRKQAL
jgi:hypothetical protein